MKVKYRMLMQIQIPAPYICTPCNFMSPKQKKTDSM